MDTRLGTALYGMLNARNDSQLQLAKRSAMSQAQINNIIRGARPNPATLKKICAASAWRGDPMPGIELLIDHLRDEAHRTGSGGEVAIMPRDPRAASAQQLIDMVERLASIVPQTIAPLIDIIGYMLEGVDHAEDTPQRKKNDSASTKRATVYKTLEKKMKIIVDLCDGVA